MPDDKPTLAQQCLSEVIGTFILVFFGLGAVHAAIATDAHEGVWQVAVVWAIAISMAIYTTSAISGTHINPAITIAIAAYREFPAKFVVAYIVAQTIGAFLAAAALYFLFKNSIAHFEMLHGITRGEPGSERTAMLFGDYFPNPDIAAELNWPITVVSHTQAIFAETIGTAFLSFFVFAVTDRKNSHGPDTRIVPWTIGLAVAMLVSVLAPLTMAGMNPARDFGPRLFAFLAGWNTIAIPGPRGGFFTVYILSPVIGGLIGGGVYKVLLQPAIPAAAKIHDDTEPRE